MVKNLGNSQITMVQEYHDMLMFVSLYLIEVSVLFKILLRTRRYLEILKIISPPIQSFWFFGSEFEFKLRTILEYYDILGENSISRRLSGPLSRAQ